MKLKFGILTCAAILAVTAGSCFAAMKDDFSAKSVDESKWVIDNDSGYELAIVNGALSIKGDPEGSGGPCDGIGSLEKGTKFSFDINPVKLGQAPSLDGNQMAVVYLAQDENRGGPVIAYGFIADPDTKGKVALAWLTSSPAEWNIIQGGLAANTFYKLGATYLADTEEMELYFQGKKVASVANTYNDGTASLVLRSGSWNGENEEAIDVLYDNVSVQ